jgi:hypothetical protein
LLDQNTGILPEESELTMLTPLAADSRFWWRVQAFNKAGQYSSWSTPRYFQTAIRPTILLAPTPGEQIMSKRPSLGWAAVTGAISYTLQVSRYGNFSTPAVNLTLTGTQYTPGSDLAAGVTYYVRVRANGLMGPSTWTETRAILIPRTPSVPVLASPASNALLTSYTPVLDWANSTIALGAPSFGHYHIQLARDSAFTDLVINQDIGIAPEESAVALTIPLTPDSKYWWRVRAFNSLEEYSSWSAVRYFKTAIRPTSLVSPAQGELPLSLRPSFNWQAVPGAVSYTLQISRYANLSYPIVNGAIKTASYSPGFNLPAGKLLYWRVRVNGVMGSSLWTETRSFSAPTPPSIPVLVSPAANVLLTSYGTARLDWGNSAISTGSPAFDHYWLQVARDEGFTDLLANQPVGSLPADSEFTITTGLKENFKYWWRVKAFNASQQESEWSAVRYFRTSMLPPVLVSPIIGQTVTALRPPFTWEAVEGASGYSIQISRYSNFSTLLFNTTSSGLGYTPTTNLPKGVTLYWRLRANGPNGPSLWSSTSFVIQ